MAGILLNETNYSGGGSGTVDTALSFDSTNAVQNKAILGSLYDIFFRDIQQEIEDFGEQAKRAYDSGSTFFVNGNGSLCIAKATTYISTSDTIGPSNIESLSIGLGAILNLFTDGLFDSDHYLYLFGNIQVSNTTATKSYTAGDYMLLSDLGFLKVAMATATITSGSSTIYTSGNNQNVSILPSVYKNIDDLANFVVNNVKANPSGTGSTDLTKLEVGGTVYNIPTAVANTLGGLTDVDISSPAATNILMYGNLGKWYNGELINDLSTGSSSYSPVSAYAVSEALDDINGFEKPITGEDDAVQGQVVYKYSNNYIGFSDLYALRGTDKGISSGKYFVKYCTYLSFSFLSSQNDTKTVNIPLSSGEELQGVTLFTPECYLSDNTAGITYPIDYCFKDGTDPSTVVRLYYRLSYTNAGVVTVNVHADSAFTSSDKYSFTGRFMFLAYKYPS